MKNGVFKSSIFLMILLNMVFLRSPLSVSQNVEKQCEKDHFFSTESLGYMANKNKVSSLCQENYVDSNCRRKNVSLCNNFLKST